MHKKCIDKITKLWKIIPQNEKKFLYDYPETLINTMYSLRNFSQKERELMEFAELAGIVMNPRILR